MPFPIDGGKKNALVVPQIRAGQINHHRDMTSERLQHNKEKERMTKRIEELEKIVERLTNENRQWKTRLEDLVAENRHLQLVKYPADELKSRSSVLMTDIKGRPSVVLADPTVKRNDAAWMSLWNVLPHVGGPNSIETNTFQPPHPEILLRCLQVIKKPATLFKYEFKQTLRMFCSNLMARSICSTRRKPWKGPSVC